MTIFSVGLKIVITLGFLATEESYIVTPSHDDRSVLDREHVTIKKPPKSSRLYHNYSGLFPIVMVALVDADYKLRWIEVGIEGFCSDAKIFSGSQVKDKIED